MPQQNPQLAQWAQRQRQALAEVKAAEARGDRQAIRAAYDNLRSVQTAKPDGQAAVKKKAPAPRGLTGVLSTITSALGGGNK